MSVEQESWDGMESDAAEESTLLETNIEFEALLNYLKQNRAFDFTGYKRASLMRRIDRRMHVVGIEGYGEYQDYLEVHSDEFGQLFDTILINVTHFFRDPAAWEYLASDILPLLIERKDPNGIYRIWSAGCASGEEAYTLAILLCEALGPDAMRDRVKIYATDIDMDALGRARLGSYTDREVAGVPPPLLAKYFEMVDSRYVFRKDLRRALIFGRNDLIQDAPISRLDMVVCRNVLMYFNAETQARIMSRFHFALNDHNFLFLGKAEMLFTQSTLFLPMNLKHRIFARLPNGRDRAARLLLSDVSNGEEILDAGQLARSRDAAFEIGAVAQIVVDGGGSVALANERARLQFGLSLRDVGRPLQDLELSYRPMDLRSAIEQATSERRAVLIQNVKWLSSPNDARWLDIQISPLAESRAAMLGVTITFTDVTRYHLLQDELEHANHSLITAYEELQSTNEELETTNEELQSTVEELETTNEELQSTNEELETMNEELQSTNEELQTMNDELRQRSDEFGYISLQMQSILSSLQVGVAVVNSELRVQIWSRRAEDMWGLRAEEAEGHNFLNLDIGLPAEQLRPAMRACLSGEAQRREITLTAVNRRGRTIRCHVDMTPAPFVGNVIQGVVLLMEESAQDGNAVRSGSDGDKTPGRDGDGSKPLARDGVAIHDGADGSSNRHADFGERGDDASAGGNGSEASDG